MIIEVAEGFMSASITGVEQKNITFIETVRNIYISPNNRLQIYV